MTPLEGELVYCTDTDELYIGHNNQWVSIGNASSTLFSTRNCASCIFNIFGQCYNPKLNPNKNEFPVDEEFTCEYWDDKHSIYMQSSIFSSPPAISLDYSIDKDWAIKWPISTSLIENQSVIKVNYK